MKGNEYGSGWAIRIYSISPIYEGHIRTREECWNLEDDLLTQYEITTPEWMENIADIDKIRNPKTSKKLKREIMKALDLLTKMKVCEYCGILGDTEKCMTCLTNYGEPCAICTEAFGFQQKLRCCGKRIHPNCFVRSYLNACQACPFCKERCDYPSYHG